MREVVWFSVLMLVLLLIFTHFYNLSIPEHQYPRLEFLKNIKKCSFGSCVLLFFNLFFNHQTDCELAVREIFQFQMFTF